MKNKKVILPIFSTSLMMIGFLILWGSAGALEVDNIGIRQTLIQSSIGAGITWLGFYLLKKGGF